MIRRATKHAESTGRDISWPLAIGHGMSWRAASLAAVIGAAALAGCGGDDDDGTGQQLSDMEFPAFLGGDTASEPVAVRLSDYFAENAPGTRILMLNAAAGWCVPCMREAEAMRDFAAEFEPQGVAILTAVFQDQNGDPADLDFVKSWVDSFELEVPALIDTDFQTSTWFDVNTMPANLFADAETLEILSIAHGAETGDDPMQEYRALLDHYLE